MALPFRKATCYRPDGARLEKTKEDLLDERFFTFLFNGEEILSLSALRENIEDLASGFIRCCLGTEQSCDISMEVDYLTGIVEIKSKEQKTLKLLREINSSRIIHLQKLDRKSNGIEIKKIKLSKLENPGLCYTELTDGNTSCAGRDIRPASSFYKALGKLEKSGLKAHETAVILNSLPTPRIFYLICRLKIPAIILRGIQPSTVITELSRKTGTALASFDRRGRLTVYEEPDFFRT